MVSWYVECKTKRQQNRPKHTSNVVIVTANALDEVKKIGTIFMDLYKACDAINYTTNYLPN